MGLNSDIGLCIALFVVAFNVAAALVAWALFTILRLSLGVVCLAFVALARLVFGSCCWRIAVSAWLISAAIVRGLWLVFAIFAMLFALFRPVLHILLLVALPSVLLFLVFVCRLVTVVAATIFGRVVFAWALFSVVFGCLSELFGQGQLLYFVAQEFFDLLEIVGIVF